jgi:hypothetical protein
VDGAQKLLDSDCRVLQNDKNMSSASLLCLVNWEAEIYLQRGTWWTESGFCLYFEGQYNQFGRTDRADDRSSWTVGIFSMPGVSLDPHILNRCSRCIQSSVNLSLVMCSRTVSYSRTITRLKPAFLNARLLDTMPPVWNMVKNAVCSPLLLSQQSVSRPLLTETRTLSRVW